MCSVAVGPSTGELVSFKDFLEIFPKFLSLPINPVGVLGVWAPGSSLGTDPGPPQPEKSSGVGGAPPDIDA